MSKENRVKKDWFDFPGLEERPEEKKWIEGRDFLVGDVHNHCGISYGHGTLEHAIAFAEAQLDFFSVTGHFAWPDMSGGELSIPPAVQDYHREGFKKLRKGWPEYLRQMQEASKRGIVPFVSYEFHSFEFGDYTIVVKDLNAQLPEEPEGRDDRLRNLIRDNVAARTGVLCIPHHIGYKEGYRGISWSRFNEKASPVVEIISMHGCAESSHAPINYLHTMGPRSRDNTMQGGLERGYRFGITGSTDHHNASPGSYGSGRTGLWSTKKASDEIFSSIVDRKTLACSGDPVMIAMFAGGAAIGDVAKAGEDGVDIDAYILSPSRLDKIELVQEGRVISSIVDFPKTDGVRRRFDFAFGWGQRNTPCSWKVSISVENAGIMDVVPRLRGAYIVDPLAKPSEKADVVPSVRHTGNAVEIICDTDGNVSPTTDCTQGFSLALETEGEYRFEVHATAEFSGKVVERTFSYCQEDFKLGPVSEYMDGFVSPSFQIDQMTEGECKCELHHHLDVDHDTHVYLRVYEKNGDFTVTSPIWIEK